MEKRYNSSFSYACATFVQYLKKGKSYMYLNSLCSEKTSKTAHRADRAKGGRGEREALPLPLFKADHFTLSQPGEQMMPTTLQVCAPHPPHLPLPDFLIFLRLGPQWAKIAEKVNKPPLGVNVII